jgi:hypothetical protein
MQLHTPSASAVGPAPSSVVSPLPPCRRGHSGPPRNRIWSAVACHRFSPSSFTARGPSRGLPRHPPGKLALTVAFAVIFALTHVAAASTSRRAPLLCSGFCTCPAATRRKFKFQNAQVGSEEGAAPANSHRFHLVATEGFALRPRRAMRDAPKRGLPLRRKAAASGPTDPNYPSLP